MDGVFEDEAWKEDLEKSLFENYGVIPKYYEDLRDGIDQVYVEVGGEVVPLVLVWYEHPLQLWQEPVYNPALQFTSIVVYITHRQE